MSHALIALILTALQLQFLESVVRIFQGLLHLADLRILRLHLILQVRYPHLIPFVNLHSFLSLGHPFLQVLNSLYRIFILIVLRLRVELPLHFLIHCSSQFLKRFDSLPMVTFYLLDLPLYLFDLLPQQPIPQLLFLLPLTLTFAIIPFDRLLQRANPSQDAVHTGVMRLESLEDDLKVGLELHLGKGDLDQILGGDLFEY